MDSEMARQLRIQYPGAVYHVMARGNRREDIVHDDADREMLLATLAETCLKTGWEVLAWVLMDNHYHWLVRTPKPNLVAGMSWFQGTYTQRYNARHQLWGHLFGGRYKAIPVQPTEKGGGDYLRALMDYIHLNPARAGMVSAEEGLGLLDYRWSSLAQGYGLPPKMRSRWMMVEEGLRTFDLPDTASGRRKFVARLEVRMAGEAQEDQGLPPEALCRGGQSTVRRGWYWGGQVFEEWLKKRVSGAAAEASKKGRSLQSSEEVRANRDEAEADRIVNQGKRVLGLTKEEIRLRPGSDPRKVAIASAVHSMTAVSQKWTAERLGMKSAVNVSQQLRRMRAGQVKLSKEIKQWLSIIAS